MGELKEEDEQKNKKNKVGRKRRMIINKGKEDKAGEEERTGENKERTIG
jgi:hypothetical protein